MRILMTGAGGLIRTALRVALGGLVQEVPDGSM